MSGLDRSAVQQALRTIRTSYDRLGRRQRVALERRRTAADLACEEAYWRIGGEFAQQVTELSHVVFLFSTTRHATREHFSFGRHVRAHLGDSHAAAARFRRVLDARNRVELDGCMDGLLRRAARHGGAVDWGTLGADLLEFFDENAVVRRRWAQDFFAPTTRVFSASPVEPVRFAPHPPK